MWCPMLLGDACRARATRCRLPFEPCPNIVAYQEQHSQLRFDRVEHLCYYIDAWTPTRGSLSEDKYRDRDRAPPDVLASVYERCMLRAALCRRCGTHRASPVTTPLRGGPRLRAGCRSRRSAHYSPMIARSSACRNTNLRLLHHCILVPACPLNFERLQ
jgi:hypothetical protein